MSNYRITISGDGKISDQLEKISSIEKVIYKWMASGEPTFIMQTSFEKNFIAEGRPKWISLAQATIDSRIKKGFSASPILARTGNLRDAVTSMKGQLKGGNKKVMLSFGTNQIVGKEEKKKYKIHQRGTSKIPARPMVMFNDQDIEIITNSIAKRIYKALK